MTQMKPETPPLTRAGRKEADAALAAAKFKSTSDGERVIRTFEVHGMAVTECVSTENGISADSPAPQRAAAEISKAANSSAKVLQTPPLTREGRKIADNALAAAQFNRTSDGKNAMRKFEVHGIAVTEFVSLEKVADSTPRAK